MIILAFWGLTRSIKYTAESIRRHVFHQLPPHLVFVHTYSSANEYKNARAHEFAHSLEADVAPLRPFKYIVDDLDQVKRMLNLKQYHTQPDPWDSNYETLDNFVLAMYSKYRVTKLIESCNLSPSKIIFLRPDVHYTQSIRPVLELASPHAWVIPNFQLYSGFNDRFCIASPYTYLQYGCIFPFLLVYSRKKQLHSETIYADFAKQQRITLIYADFFFQRIRIGGEPDVRDLHRSPRGPRPTTQSKQPAGPTLGRLLLRHG